MNFVELIHKDDITIKEIKEMYEYVSEHSDGINVTLFRSESGLDNSDKSLWRWYKKLVWVTKSKLMSLKFCTKSYQLSTIFGIRSPGTVVSRQGTNEHYIMELIFDELDSEKLKHYYIYHKTIKIYLTKQLKKLASKLLDAVDFEAAMETIDNNEGERDHYINAINAIAKWLSRFYKRLVNKVGIDKVSEYFYPIGSEVELYDTLLYRHGLIDAIFKNPDGGYIPVDYKFGKPKRKKDYYGNITKKPGYYMPSVTMELVFYKLLAESQNCYEPDEQKGEMKKWKPLRCKMGEMWYILDYEYGKLSVTFTIKDEIELIKLEEDYWRRMNTMDYAFNPQLGWKSKRYNKLCNAISDGKFKCDRRPLCDHFLSFSKYVNEKLKIKEMVNVMKDI